MRHETRGQADAELKDQRLTIRDQARTNVGWRTEPRSARVSYGAWNCEQIMLFQSKAPIQQTMFLLTATILNFGTVGHFLVIEDWERKNKIYS